MDRKEMLARLKKGEDPLELSIEKWKDIVEGKGEDVATLNCALCEVHKDCKTCPIFEKSNEHDCHNTPYVTYQMAIATNKNEKVVKARAKKELEFLKSLRK